MNLSRLGFRTYLLQGKKERTRQTGEQKETKKFFIRDIDEANKEEDNKKAIGNTLSEGDDPSVGGTCRDHPSACCRTAP